MNAPQESHDEDTEADGASVETPRLWCDVGWTARVIKNDDDEGWAVAMIKDGEREPALVGPWTMGRDKKNPKPLDSAAFSTLVKTASEVIRRHEQQLHAILHKQVELEIQQQTYRVTLDIVPDEDEPYAMLKAQNALGEEFASVKVLPTFKLTRTSAQTWIEAGFPKQN
ncbi:MAG: hypothetical protein V4695_07405 [Pseudomonadota bacterium]